MDFTTKMKFGLSVLRYKVTGKRVPVAVAWLITGRCDQDCRYCKWKQERHTKELDTAAVKDMIDQMQQAGALLISFTGGEPLIRDDIGEIIRHVKRRGLVCKVNTNGRLIGKRLDDLREVDILQIDVDGPSDVQDRLRGDGSSESAAQAIRMAQEAGIRVQLVTCLTKDNVSRLDEVLDYALELGEGLCLQMLSAEHLEQDAIDGSFPARDDAIKALEYLIKLKKDRHPKAKAIASTISEIEYYLDVARNDLRGCNCALVTATMLPDGRLIFCGNGKNYETYDAIKLGFAEAFFRLRIPDCDGCVCVGKHRLSRVYQFDMAIIKEMLKL